MNCKKFLSACLGCVLSLFLNATETPSFTIANTLQSNMVVQQGKPLVIWGGAKQGTRISVKATWEKNQRHVIANKQGVWEVTVPVPFAKPGFSPAHSLSISSGVQARVLDNILIGDVWLCSGQSNMDMELKPFLPWLLGAMHYRMEIENANYPQIRFFSVRTDFKATPQQDCGGTWEVCSPVNAPDFSALAYFFAREIFNRQKIPVGLVVSSVGGSSAQAWMSRETLTDDSKLFQKYLFPYDTSTYSKQVLDSAVTFEKVVRPTLFFNAMIHPLKKLQLKGALWYQGESNRFDSLTYTGLCAALIRNWRTLFKNADLPFYFVQVAPYNWQQNDTMAYDYALFREAQANIRSVVSNTEMAVTMDIADPFDLHPRNKQDVGYRLAKIALANAYNVPNTVYKGPEYAGHQTENGILKVRFSNTGSGLITNDGESPKHFFIAGKDGVFHYAQATIKNEEVWLQSKEVTKPVAVRYAFTNYPVTNFENKEGFPAVPFRSDF